MDAGILFLIALALYPFLEGFKDGNTLSLKAKEYHVAGWLTRAMVAICLVPAWYWLGLYAAYFWIVFDGARNVTAGDPVLFVGSTGYLDKLFGQKIIWAKIFLLIVSTLFVLFKLTLL
jgi:hypothetical protein